MASFAEASKFDEANASIAALASVPVAIAENMMIETRAEGVMILAKVAGLAWATVRAIIRMRDELSGGEPTDIATCKHTYERLRPSTAQQVLRFHRMQQNAPAASSSRRSGASRNPYAAATIFRSSEPVHAAGYKSRTTKIKT